MLEDVVKGHYAECTRRNLDLPVKVLTVESLDNVVAQIKRLRRQQNGARPNSEDLQHIFEGLSHRSND